MIKAFGGLEIIRAIAGNINSSSREIYAQIKSLQQQGFFSAIARNCFVFPAIAGIFPRNFLGIVPAFYDEGEKAFCQKRHVFQCFYSAVDKATACEQCRPGFYPCCVQFYLLHHSFIYY